jgi:D-serine deaminase-like pyridoxal phosphate-dependent protein
MNANAYLIGVPGGRRSLDTPALLIDLPALKRNIGRMAELAKTRRIGLRPHAKCHKSVEIAQLQIEAGALGVCCATLGEAEVMVEAGVPGVLITSPVVGKNKLRRIAALAGKAGPNGLMIVIDNPSIVADLAQATAELPFPLQVLIDYHAGYHRTGVLDEQAALELARRIAEEDALLLRGVQAYGGNLQHIADRGQKEEATANLRRNVSKIVAALEATGAKIDIVTGVGTGTHDVDSRDQVFTEMQVGSYVFMDVEYAQALTDPNYPLAFETTLFVQGTVVSTNAEPWVTLDAGIKSFATDSVKPIVARGVDGPSRYEFYGDEHGKLIVDAQQRPTLGACVEFMVPHCDPTVNLHNVYHVVDGDTLIDIWPIQARGRL